MPVSANYACRLLIILDILRTTWALWTCEISDCRPYCTRLYTFLRRGTRTFDQSAFSRASSFAHETLDVRRHQLLVPQQTAHVQVIVNGNVRTAGRVQRRRRLCAADRGRLQRRQHEQTPAETSEYRLGGEDLRPRRRVHRVPVFETAEKKEKKVARRLVVGPRSLEWLQCRFALVRLLYIPYDDNVFVSTTTLRVYGELFSVVFIGTR